MEQFNNLAKMIPKLGATRLKDVIKAIRACKTAADERAVIAKESANIRTAFKDESNEARYDNIAKLLYIHMLGYPAHFGQIECLKLVASPRFADKRLAYLGIMLLLDENQETLTLVTNCLKNDMNNTNMFTVGLALCTLGNIASQEMSRDLSGEVERLLGSTNSYLRKKASLCALRIIRKVPDLIENFLDRAQALLDERNHGVLLTGVTLLTEMCIMSPHAKDIVRNNVPLLVRHLKALVTAGSSPEHDVNGISDPFLQVKILRLLRILGKGDARASEAMNDVLAQVATTTEASKNVGNSILYETVLTIMDVESESSLRVLGINILGRFLSNRDNNIKYVALTTLTKTSQTAAATDASALQRHRSTILDCLRDPDVSIRRRALDLSFYLINPTNIRILTRELLSFLEIAESDIKSSVASRICEYAGRYRPNKRWEIDTVTRVLRVAGAYVDQAAINHFVKLVSTGDVAVHQYAVRKLYNIVKNEGEMAHIQEGLLQAAFWCIGEYGDVLVSSTTSAVGFGVEEDADMVAIAGASTSDPMAIPTEQDVYALYASILRGPYATSYVKEYAVTSLVKLCTRFHQQPVVDQIKALIAKYRVNIDVEIQQRAVEYTQILGLDVEARMALLERMPVLESAVAEETLKGTGGSSVGGPGNMATVGGGGQGHADLLGNDLAGLALGGNANAASGGGGGFVSGAPAAAGQPRSENIMDLLGGIGLGGSAAAVPSGLPSGIMGGALSHAAAPKPADLLGDLFGSGAATMPTAASAAKPVVAVDPLASLTAGLGLGASSATASMTPKTAMASPSTATAKTYPCYEKNNLRITLTPTRDTPIVTSILATFTHTSTSPSAIPITNLSLQVAVPKTLKLVMHPATATQLEPGQVATQVVKVDNPTKVPIRLRLKIVYSGCDEVVEFSGFDASLWA